MRAVISALTGFDRIRTVVIEQMRNEVSFDQLILVSASVGGFLLADRRTEIPWQ